MGRVEPQKWWGNSALYLCTRCSGEGTRRWREEWRTATWTILEISSRSPEHVISTTSLLYTDAPVKLTVVDNHLLTSLPGLSSIVPACTGSYCTACSSSQSVVYDTAFSDRRESRKILFIAGTRSKPQTRISDSYNSKHVSRSKVQRATVDTKNDKNNAPAQHATCYPLHFPHLVFFSSRSQPRPTLCLHFIRAVPQTHHDAIQTVQVHGLCPARNVIVPPLRRLRLFLSLSARLSIRRCRHGDMEKA